MALTLLVRSGAAETPPQITVDGPRIVVGRSEACDVRLPDPSVSHRHASIRQRGSDYIVMDEGSTNGTFVGPVRLAPHAPRVLRSGDLLRVGRVWLEARVEQSPPPASTTAAAHQLALALVAESLAAGGQPADPQQLASALRELEAADDEPLGDSDLLAPPTTGAGEDEDPELADRTVLSRRAAAVAARSAPPGWTLTDVLVALLALAVLGLSLAGLAWVLGG